MLHERAHVPHSLLLAGVLRKLHNYNVVVGRRRLNAEHSADVLHLNVPFLGRTHKGALGEAEARGKLGHDKPAQAAVEAGARLLVREALQRHDCRGERVDGVGVLVAAAFHPYVDTCLCFHYFSPLEGLVFLGEMYRESLGGAYCESPFS